MNRYLDKTLLDRLFKKYGVKPITIIQNMGDAVFIPAGAPHQVRNINNCIEIAIDFVSPENAADCLHLSTEFSQLSDAYSNREDKLQIKNILYHTMKDIVSVLSGNYNTILIYTIHIYAIFKNYLLISFPALNTMQFYTPQHWTSQY